MVSPMSIIFSYIHTLVYLPVASLTLYIPFDISQWYNCLLHTLWFLPEGIQFNNARNVLFECPQNVNEKRRSTLRGLW